MAEDQTPTKPKRIPRKKQAEVEEFKEEFWDILAQAGVTKKRLLYF